MKPNEFIDLVNETDFKPDLGVLNSIFGWLKEDMLFEQSDYCCLKLVKNKDVVSYNHKYRGKNAPTDVLTFPCEIKNIPFKGDIIIDIEVADKQKGKYSLAKEVAILFIHSLLHLAGMDHMTKKDQLKMQLYEEKYHVRLAEILH